MTSHHRSEDPQITQMKADIIAAIAYPATDSAVSTYAIRSDILGR
jgi:hypothetical protein